MSTITSPRPSLPSPSLSRRTSTSTSRASSPARHANSPPQQRRNRAALRDYYGLKAAVAPTPADASSGLQHQHEDTEIKDSELDREGFDPEAYVKGVLGREGLEGILRVEGGLIAEIRGLDGERKALVYDNYSKLIAATDTIRKMRTNMDPLTPTTSTLSPAIAHIASTAASLTALLQGRSGSRKELDDRRSPRFDQGKRRAQRETVRWALGTPPRLRGLLEKGDREEAIHDWKEVQGLLDKWEGVGGVEDVRQECLKVLEEYEERSNAEGNVKEG
ncbi:hypothetical protein MMC06_000984 [Schaereria dolodes]|nr:hypothetical protein [Schaereria dolodes]